MIYLIGGAPRVGKSIIAKRLAEKLSIRFVSTDELCERYSQAIPEAEREEKFPFPGFSGDSAENKSAPEELVGFQLTEAKSLEPEIRRIISRALSKDEALVIEGVQMLPDFVQSIAGETGPERIRVIFVGSKDAERVTEGITKNSSPDNWMKNSDPAVISQVARFVAAFSVWLDKECQKFGLPYVERTDDFEEDVQRIVGLVSR